MSDHLPGSVDAGQGHHSGVGWGCGLAVVFSDASGRSLDDCLQQPGTGSGSGWGSGSPLNLRLERDGGGMEWARLGSMDGAGSPGDVLDTMDLELPEVEIHVLVAYLRAQLLGDVPGDR